MKIKRNKKSYKWFLCGLIMVVVLTISYRVSKANYRISNSIELTTGKVISSPYDFNIVSMYIDGVEQDKNAIIPTTGYIIDEENSYCCKTTPCNKENKDENVILKTIASLHTFNGISRGSKCNLYFDKININSPTTMNELIQDYYINKKTRLKGTFNEPITNETKNTIYVDADDDGETYYFAGNPLDNWVYFGGYYWRIVRINGDGTIRLVYQGITTNDEDGAVIGKGGFSGSNCVGYLCNQNTPAYNAVNSWFKDTANLDEEIYFSKIDKNAGFCNDTSSYSDKEGTTPSTDSNPRYYGAYIRRLNLNPTFECPNENDLYTYKEATNGNKKLEYPIGFLTADEVMYAGVNSSRWRHCYLTNSNSKLIWTMSPSYYENSERVFMLSADSILDAGSVTNAAWTSSYYRPVINLKKDITFTGSGTTNSPFVVV